MSAAASKSVPGAAAMSGSGVLAATAARLVHAWAVLDAAPALRALGIQVVRASAHLTAAAAISPVGSIAARSAMAAAPRLIITGRVARVAAVTLATVAGLGVTAQAGPDLWGAYTRAASAAETAWETWAEARAAGGSLSAGRLYEAAYSAQAAADEAYAAWVAAQREMAGVRG
jgi:hypothetical protein